MKRPCTMACLFFLLLLAISYSVNGAALKTEVYSPGHRAMSRQQTSSLGKSTVTGRANQLSVVQGNNQSETLTGATNQQPPTPTPQNGPTFTQLTWEEAIQTLKDQYPDQWNEFLARQANQTTTAAPTNSNSSTTLPTTTASQDKNKDWFTSVLSRADVQERIVQLVSLGRGDVGLFKDENDLCYLTDKNTENVYFTFDC